MLKRRAYTGFFNLAFRALTLFFRFLLSFYITKFLGFEQAGVYGLCLGAVGIMPAMIGWGLNYFVSRDVVGLARSDAVTLVSTRLSVTLTSLMLASIALLGVSVMSGHDIETTELQICTLIWLETVALDIHMPLIGMNQSVIANILVFIRTASWVLPCIAVSLIWDSFRTLGVVFNFWIFANIVSLAITAYIFRDWPMRASAILNSRSMVKLLASYRSWLIYLSDIGLVGSIFLDRYVITFVLGIESTGVYFFYWSLTSAVQTLVSTAVVQVALPKLVDAFKRGDMARWRKLLISEFTKAAYISLIFLVIIYFSASILIDLVHIPRDAEGNAILLLLLVTTLFRVCNEVVNLAFASVNKDKIYAHLNLFNCFLSILCTFFGATFFSLVGAACGVMLSTGVMLCIRIWIIVSFLRAANQVH